MSNVDSTKNNNDNYNDTKVIIIISKVIIKIIVLIIMVMITLSQNNQNQNKTNLLMCQLIINKILHALYDHLERPLFFKFSISSALDNYCKLPILLTFMIIVYIISVK